jgi:hypothetical protein
LSGMCPCLPQNPWLFIFSSRGHHRQSSEQNNRKLISLHNFEMVIQCTSVSVSVSARRWNLQDNFQFYQIFFKTIWEMSWERVHSWITDQGHHLFQEYGYLCTKCKSFYRDIIFRAFSAKLEQYKLLTICFFPL